jgi:glutamyl-tRNA reductase
MRDSFAALDGKKVVLFGLGKLGRNTCRNLAKHHRTSEITVVNRDSQKTLDIAGEFGFRSAGIQDLKKVLMTADVLILATGAEEYTVTKGMILPEKELLILDMSMPRNADPSLEEQSNVRIVHVDELSKAANIRLGDRLNHLPKAKEIVAQEIKEFSALLDSLAIAPTLGLVSKNLRTFRDIEMTKLGLDDEKEEQRLLLLSDKIIQKVTTQVATFLKTKSDDVGEDMTMFEDVFQRPTTGND